MKKLILTLIAGGILLFFLVVAMGCQTVSGLGRDISSMSDGNSEAHYKDRNR